MATVSRTIKVPLSDVFDALRTPETYPHWLVGCRAIRDVDDDWPAVGSAFHHRVGLVGPLTIADLSKVLEIDEPRRLSLEVRTRPLGRARARFTLTEEQSGASPATRVELDEVPIGLIAPTRPLVDPLIAKRNRASLANLAAYLERGESRDDPVG